MLQRCYQNDVQQTLKELPKSLDETYARMLRNIAQTDRVIRLLQCLSVAIRPLRVEELAEVLALDFDGPRAEGAPPELKDHRPLEDRQRDVLSMCSSLIIIVNNDDSDVIKFSHFTVKEFLTSDRLSTSEEYKDISQFRIKNELAHTTLAQACLGTLLRLDGSSKLKGYASRHWVKHAQFGTVSSQLTIGMRRLFDSAEPYFAAWLRVYDIDYDIDYDVDDLIGHDDRWGYTLTKARGSPLYYASLCGFCDLAAHIISEHQVQVEQVNARGGHCHFPLVAALYNGHNDMAALLRRHGAAVDAPLQVASVDGRSDVVRWLLDHDADPDSQQDDRQSPIYLATMNGHPEVVRTLLGHRVRINAVSGIADNLVPLAIFYASPKKYRRETGIDLLTHQLTAQFQTCKSPSDILAILSFQVSNQFPTISRPTYDISPSPSEIPPTTSEIPPSPSEIPPPMSKIQPPTFEIPPSPSEVLRPVSKIPPPTSEIPPSPRFTPAPPSIVEIPLSLSEIPQPPPKIPQPPPEIPRSSRFTPESGNDELKLRMSLNPTINALRALSSVLDESIGEHVNSIPFYTISHLISYF